MNRANALRSSVAPGALLRAMALGAIAALGATLPATAATRYYYQSDSGYFDQQMVQRPPRHQQRARKGTPAKKETQVKDTTVHPQMPLIINVSIAKQRVRIYDANGFFAEGPVSTGMPGHPTPMGVFSVIEKDRYHHSNIYSGAPMPFMQRITWGGVALHAGVLPGYPASHGCIRMPEAFAVKMWGWTKMGARVIVTPGELEPAKFAHALLPTTKVVPQPVAEQETSEQVAAKADKGAPELTPIEASLELRSTVGHDDKPAEETSRRDQTRTAEAGDTRANTTMSDASSGREPAHEGTPAKADEAKSDTKPNTPVAEAAKQDDANKAETAKAETAKAETAKAETVKAETVKPETVKADSPPADTKDSDAAKPEMVKPVEVVDAAKPADGTVSADKPAEAKPPEPTVADAKPADNAAKPSDTASVKAGDKPPETPKPDTAKADTAKADTAKADTAKADTAKPGTAKPDTTKPADKPAEAAKAVTNAADPDSKKDQTKVTDKSNKDAKRREEQRRGQIAVFISRKDNKLYVRQNFAPLFEVPVTIAPSDRPLGTHVFTAEVDKADTNVLHWSVITVPMSSARAAMRDSDEPRLSRRQQKGKKPVPAPVEAKPTPLPDSPAEALDRITIPPEVMARISEVMTSGASIVVSDQGIAQGETGEYTDFIVRYY